MTPPSRRWLRPARWQRFILAVLGLSLVLQVAIMAQTWWSSGQWTPPVPSGRFNPAALANQLLVLGLLAFGWSAPADLRQRPWVKIAAAAVAAVILAIMAWTIVELA